MREGWRQRNCLCACARVWCKKTHLHAETCCLPVWPTHLSKYLTCICRLMCKCTDMYKSIYMYICTKERERESETHTHRETHTYTHLVHSLVCVCMCPCLNRKTPRCISAHACGEFTCKEYECCYMSTWLNLCTCLYT